MKKLRENFKINMSLIETIDDYETLLKTVNIEIERCYVLSSKYFKAERILTGISLPGILLIIAFLPMWIGAPVIYILMYAGVYLHRRIREISKILTRYQIAINKRVVWLCEEKMKNLEIVEEKEND